MAYALFFSPMAFNTYSRLRMLPDNAVTNPVMGAFMLPSNLGQQHFAARQRRQRFYSRHIYDLSFQDAGFDLGLLGFLDKVADDTSPGPLHLPCQTPQRSVLPVPATRPSMPSASTARRIIVFFNTRYSTPASQNLLRRLVTSSTVRPR